MQHFDENQLFRSFTLLANLLTDTRDREVLELQKLCPLLLSFPIERWAPEYFRLTTRLLLSKGIDLETHESLLDIHMRCVLTGSIQVSLQRSALSGLRDCCIHCFSSVVERRLLGLVPYLRSLLLSQDKIIIPRTLEICAALFEKSQSFQDCLITEDLASLLHDVMCIENMQIRELAVDVACLYATSTAGFGETDAAALAAVDFATFFQEGPYALKVRVIELCEILARFLSEDTVATALAPPLVQVFAEILEADEPTGRRALYHLCGRLLRLRRETYGAMLQEAVAESVAADALSAELAPYAEVLLALLDE